MTDAAVAEKPVAKRVYKRSSELLDSRAITIEQKPSIEQPPIDEEMTPTPDIIVVDQLKKDHAERLAFMEEPVKIMIQRSGEKFSPMTTDLVAVNGIKAEILFKNGWVQIGYLPRGQGFYTKRKYVEQLAQAKICQVSTRVVETPGEDPRNFIDPVTTPVFGFNVLEDKSPKAAEWIERLMIQHG